MTIDWTPVFVLPNIPLETAIGCDIALLAPAHDPRVAALKRAHPMFRRFLHRFSDNFGAKFEPTVLLLDTAAPPIFREVDALAGFRDLVAIATVTRGRALELRYPRGLRILFGEAFSIYPWMLDRHFEDIIGSSPAILGTHEVAAFRGQSSPASGSGDERCSSLRRPFIGVCSMSEEARRQQARRSPLQPRSRARLHPCLCMQQDRPGGGGAAGAGCMPRRAGRVPGWDWKL